MTGLDLSQQSQAGLGRPANYKKGAVVAAALGLRNLRKDARTRGCETNNARSTK
ncbi:MAG: hypothetical protein R6U62_08195 [Bacteroidales bacterium]